LDSITADTIVVLDHYGLDTQYQKTIKEKGCKLVCIDDLHDKEFFADLIINHAPNIEPSAYHAQTYTQFALGLEYVLLRPAFLRKLNSNTTILPRSNIFICLGGSDSGNKTLEIVEYLKDNFKGLINIVVGASYPFLGKLRDYLEKNDMLKRAFIHYNINEYEMVSLMQLSGIGICSSSSISIEYLSVSKGLLFLLLTADNQTIWYNYALLNKMAYPLSRESFENLNTLEVNYPLLDKVFCGNQTENLIQLFKQL
jgi:spore coat polysaccharide biosynthesis predicted glycosyltransferase SpsG